MARGPRNHIAYYNRRGASNKARAPGFASWRPDFVGKIAPVDGTLPTVRAERNLPAKRPMTTVPSPADLLREIVQRVQGYDLPVVHDGDAVAAFGLSQVACCHEDRHLPVALQLQDIVPVQGTGPRFRPYGGHSGFHVGRASAPRSAQRILPLSGMLCGTTMLQSLMVSSGVRPVRFNHG